MILRLANVLICGLAAYAIYMAIWVAKCLIMGIRTGNAMGMSILDMEDEDRKALGYAIVDSCGNGREMRMVVAVVTGVSVLLMIF